MPSEMHYPPINYPIWLARFMAFLVALKVVHHQDQLNNFLHLPCLLDARFDRMQSPVSTAVTAVR